MPLMYIETGLMPQQGPQGGSRKYHGAVAQNYDAKRENSPKWQAEQKIVESMLDGLAEGEWVLDCPVGTGRFIPYYEERKLQVRGHDISADMLALATQKVTDKMRFRFAQTPVWDTQLWDDSVDAAVMVRLTRWLMEENGNRIEHQFHAAMKELQRVARKMIIFTARVRNHPFMVPYELIDSTLDGWKIARDEVGYEENYRVIMLEPE